MGPTRRPGERVERAGFTFTSLEPVAIPGPSVLNHVILGRCAART
ncbi:hypothetical protein [Actinomycetospora sp.]